MKSQTLLMDIDLLPRSDRPCPECSTENDITLMRRDGYEKVCPNCQTVIGYERGVNGRRDPWQSYRKKIERARETGERPIIVGGDPDAYWGDGEYAVSPGDGFTVPSL